MAGITQKSSVAAFPVWSLDKQNDWIKISENDMKDIIGISIAYLRVHLRWGTWNKKRKTRFSVKVEPTKSFNVKTSSKYLLDMEKDPFFLPYTHTPSSNTVGLLLLLQQNVGKSKLVFVTNRLL